MSKENQPSQKPVVDATRGVVPVIKREGEVQYSDRRGRFKVIRLNPNGTIDGRKFDIVARKLNFK